MCYEAPSVNPQRAQIAELAAKSRLPAIYIQAGICGSRRAYDYGANITDLYRRAATYVDKILKGAKPADLPVEQPKKFEFIINLKAAKQIGLTIPPNVLARADKVIKMNRIFDYRFWIDSGDKSMKNISNRFRFSFRQSEICNPKSKMGGAFCNRRRAQVCGARSTRSRQGKSSA